MNGFYGMQLATMRKIGSPRNKRTCLFSYEYIEGMDNIILV